MSRYEIQPWCSNGAADPDECAATEALSSAGLPGMLSEFSGSPPSIRITEPATPIPVTGWTPFLDHGFLGPFDSGIRLRCKALKSTSDSRLQGFLGTLGENQIRLSHE